MRERCWSCGTLVSSHPSVGDFCPNLACEVVDSLDEDDGVVAMPWSPQGAALETPVVLDLAVRMWPAASAGRHRQPLVC